MDYNCSFVKTIVIPEYMNYHVHIYIHTDKKYVNVYFLIVYSANIDLR